jgi:ferritin-like metal-binding protein YciE
MKTLNDLFLDELADIYDAERRVAKALPKLAKSATCKELKVLIQSHVNDTEGHAAALEAVFESFDKKAKGKTCEATVGLIEEAHELATEFKGSPAINAALISALQKVEHYKMASYGCLHEWAGLLGCKKAATLLQGILEEERDANDALTELARSSSNDQALAQTDEPKTKSTKGRVSPLARRGVRPVKIPALRSGGTRRKVTS